ncbi:MAG: NAD-dependent epimerase/dehydratase family protein [Candidatus Uhrbacteria bacterium]
MKRKYSKILVTGGAGFIGSHVVDALVGRRFETFVIDNLSTGNIKNVNPNAKFFKMDLRSPNLPKLMAKIKPDAIFHLAAQLDVRLSVKDPIEDADINILGSLNLLQAAVNSGVKKIIFSSTGGAMYPGSLRPPYSEKDPELPISPYGIAKRTVELYLNFLRSIHGISFVALRYANVYGPRQNSKGEAGVVAIFSEKMLKNLPIKINGLGTQTRDYVYVDDVVKANLLALEKRVSGLFNIGTAKETSVNEIFKKIKKFTKYQLPESHGPACPGEVLRSSLNYKQATKELGWRPEVKLDDGLKRMVQWFVLKNGL